MGGGLGPVVALSGQPLEVVAPPPELTGSDGSLACRDRPIPELQRETVPDRLLRERSQAFPGASPSSASSPQSSSAASERSSMTSAGRPPI